MRVLVLALSIATVGATGCEPSVGEPAPGSTPWCAPYEPPPRCVLVERVEDGDGDGEDDLVVRHRYDPDWRLIGSDVEYVPSNASSTTSYLYNACGALVREERDDDQNGSVNLQTTWSYVADSTGALATTIQRTHIGDFDNSILTHVSETRSEGPDQRLSEYTADSNADGTPDERRTYRHDEQGNRVAEFIDSGADGTVDRVVEQTYSYDDAGRVLRHEWSQDNELRYTTEYDYDEAGNPVRERYDQDGDGLVDRAIAYTYEDDGKTVHRDEDDDADGQPDERWTTTYDDAGRLLSIDGPDGRLEVSYDVLGNEIESRRDDFDDKGLTPRIRQSWSCDPPI